MKDQAPKPPVQASKGLRTPFTDGHHVYARASLRAGTSGQTEKVEETFSEFNQSWLVYWEASVELQNQLYESVKAARRSPGSPLLTLQKMTEVNQVQHQLFASIPRRIDYTRLGQVTQIMDNAFGKLNELQTGTNN